MTIKETKKVGNGYEIYFENCDMIAFVHKKEEIEDLKKKGLIKEEKIDKLINKKGK